MFTAILIGCEQIDEANKLIDSSNKKVAEGQAIFVKALADNDVLLNGEVEDLKTTNAAKANEVIANYDKAGDLFKAAAKDFDEAGKLKLSDKLKTYIGLKSKQLAKSGEYISALKTGLQVLMTAPVSEMEAKMNDYKTKTDALSKEVSDLDAQVTKFEAENKDVIK
jgi:hypothetical protein